MAELEFTGSTRAHREAIDDVRSLERMLDLALRELAHIEQRLHDLAEMR